MLGVLLCATAVAQAAAVAANAPTIRYTPAGLALARRAVLRLSDLGAASGWTGGSRTPDLTHPPVCADYHPDRAGIVVTGAAESGYAAHAIGIEINSETQVLGSAHMLALSFERTLEPATVVSCMAGVFARSAGSHSHVVSAARVSFPKITPQVAAFRFLIDVPSGSQLARYLVDFTVVGKGRVELTLTTVAFLGLTRLSDAAVSKAETVVAANEAVLVRRLVARAVPSGPLAA
jgi:hypothetical protein